MGPTEKPAFEVEGASRAFVDLQCLSLVQAHLAGERGDFFLAGLEDSLTFMKVWLFGQLMHQSSRGGTLWERMSWRLLPGSMR